MRTYIVAVVVACGVVACSRGPRAEPLAVFPVDSRVLRGNESGLRDAMERVITTAQDLSPIWQQAVSTQRTPPPQPQVDFTRSMLLVVAAGRMFDEDAVRVDSVVEREVAGPSRTQRVLHVHYTLVAGCRRADSQSAYPVEIVQVRRYTGDVRFVPQRVSAANCR